MFQNNIFVDYCIVPHVWLYGEVVERNGHCSTWFCTLNSSVTIKCPTRYVPPGPAFVTCREHDKWHPKPARHCNDHVSEKGWNGMLSLKSNLKFRSFLILHLYW